MFYLPFIKFFDKGNYNLFNKKLLYLYKHQKIYNYYQKK